MSLTLLYPETLGNGCAQFETPLHVCHVSLPYIIGFDINIIHQRIQTTRLHSSRCHYWGVDFVLFHYVTCYTNSLLSCIHVNNAYLLNITCTLVATYMILGRLHCIVIFSNMDPPTNLLLLILKRVFNPSMTSNHKLKIVLGGHESLAAHVHNPPHDSRPPKCSWLAACAYLHDNTSNPLLSRI
jgi:hypothetical protein